MADEIYLDVFTDFTVSSISLLSLYFYLSNDLPLSDLLLMDSFFLLGACGFSVLLTVSILFFAMGGVMAYFNTLGFVPMTLNNYLKFFPLVVTNDVLEYMISVLDLLYLVYYKTKVIVTGIYINV